jgi:hypothetical protein
MEVKHRGLPVSKLWRRRGFQPRAFQIFPARAFDGGFSNAKDRGDVGIRLPLGRPEQRFRCPARETEFQQGFG